MRSWDKYCEDTVGMHKPLNRVGDAYGWPYVRYSLLQPIVGRFIQPEWR